jgi:hypothetical protein
MPIFELPSSDVKRWMSGLPANDCIFSLDKEPYIIMEFEMMSWTETTEEDVLLMR